MSSTNRSNARDEHRSDYYVTPVEEIESFLKAFDKHCCFNLLSEALKEPDTIIIDPCAGGNYASDTEAEHEMSYPAALRNVFGDDLNIITYDIRQDSKAEHKEDYLKAEINKSPYMIITNPPFNQAEKIIEKALKDCENNDGSGFVIMLLRLNFFGGKSRREFFEKYMPDYCFVHTKRMSFTDKKDKNGKVEFKPDGTPKKGGTDSIEYAHFVWLTDGNERENPEYTKLFLI